MKKIIPCTPLRFLCHLGDNAQYTGTHIDLRSDLESSAASKAKHYLDKNKRHITRAELAEALHYNGDYINRIFKKHFGYSIKDYNQKVYMNEALELLTKTNRSVSEISKQLGFENKTHFYKLFDQYYGTTPSVYRKQKR